jgi:hypothetical protein
MSGSTTRWRHRCRFSAKPDKVCDDMGRMVRPDAEDTEVVLRYGAHPWLEGQPALVTRRHGSGRISYLGVWPDDALMDGLVSWLRRVSPLPEPMTMPDGVFSTAAGAPTRVTRCALFSTQRLKSRRLH